MQRGTFALICYTLDDPYALLLNTPQEDGFSRACCQATHSRQSKVAQTGPLHIDLGQVVDTRPKIVAALLRLLYHAAVLQCFEQAMHAAFTHIKRSRQVRERESLL